MSLTFYIGEALTGVQFGCHGFEVSAGEDQRAAQGDP